NEIVVALGVERLLRIDAGVNEKTLTVVVAERKRAQPTDMRMWKVARVVDVVAPQYLPCRPRAARSPHPSRRRRLRLRTPHDFPSARSRDPAAAIASPSAPRRRRDCPGRDRCNPRETQKSLSARRHVARRASSDRAVSAASREYLRSRRQAA